MASRTDALGTRNFSYNNQGLQNGITSPFGTERSVTYDKYDMPTTVVDANGVSVSGIFDRLGRRLTRAVPGQGTESFVYSARGLTDYTGPDGKTNHYGYDERLRKISETTPKIENIGYSYSAAGDLLTLTDPRAKTTTWTYDIEGLVRGKQYQGQSFTNLVYSYDANQRLAWRKFYSSATVSAQTTYGFDDAGNLSWISYPNNPGVSFGYNENNHPSWMITAGLGTTYFTYTDAGNPSSEYGLWANDAVSPGYDPAVPRLRASLTIQQPGGNWVQNYGYDAADRLKTITGPAGAFTYTYRGPGTVWTNLSLPVAAAITNAYDSGRAVDGHRAEEQRGGHSQPAPLSVQRRRPAPAADLDGWRLYDLWLR